MTHLGETQFPGDTAVIRAENKKMFGEDVKHLHRHHRHAHPVCRRRRCHHQIVADMELFAKVELRNNWWQRSQHLKAYGLH